MRPASKQDKKPMVIDFLRSDFEMFPFSLVPLQRRLVLHFSVKFFKQSSVSEAIWDKA